MRNFVKPEMTPCPEIRDDRRIYRGNSMYRIFAPGDLLLTEPLSAGEVRRGDVICFDHPKGMPTVHRVVGRTGGGEAITMGDNNPRPDALPLPPGHAVLRVRAVRKPSGAEIPVRGGARGMLTFRLNRMRRAGARLSAMAAGALRRINPFRLSLNYPVRFGEEEIFFFHNRAVAKRIPNRNVTWLSPWFRALFKIGDASK